MTANDSQYSLRNLFAVTTCLAFAAWLISLGTVSPFLAVIGIGVTCYFVSRGCDMMAERSPSSVAFIPLSMSALAIGFAAQCMLLGLVFYVFGFVAR